MSEVKDFPIPPIVQQRLDEISASTKGSGGGNSGDMEQRITRLEVKLDKVDDRLRGVEIGLATLTERVGHLPSKGFIVSALLASLAVVTALILFQKQIMMLLFLN
ncbi:hypothetical protein [Pseudorhodobacter sp.]|uniref:hypothetical protein n=1 Tax=Pseudorhodobacter sp. TaxID=1934400 RepID=UPI002649EB93|nr:hypothetical protein [Pseudorhodobacter sp.]MDN5785707.1 hypothetical protein [Pseudorhodobacter sp.]